MRGWCNFRIDPETDVMIEALAKRSFRNRSEIMRMLVHIALQKPEMFYPDLLALKNQKLVSQDQQVKNEGL